MGVARGLRQAVAGDAGQREFDGCLETHAMTDGDIDRLHSGARAHDRPDGLCAIDQRRPRAFHVWRFVMMAGEPGLGRPDGGDIQQHPEMANVVIGGFGGCYFQVHHCLACFRGCASGSSG
jgi:hypothetical protein